MRFRDDIDPTNTWIVSDTHFHHKNIGEYCHRPEEFDQILIAEWRKAVPDDATVIHLGDLNYGNNARFKHIVAPELTGERKILIEGNHDKQRFSYYKDCGFSLTKKPFAIGYGLQFPLAGEVERLSDLPAYGGPPPKTEFKHVVSFSHYPWNEKTEGVMPSNHLRLHGHIHNNGYSRDAYVPFLKQHINLSVEQTKYRPVNLKLLLDAALLGVYPETTEEQLAEVRQRRQENLERKNS